MRNSGEILINLIKPEKYHSRLHDASDFVDGESSTHLGDVCPIFLLIIKLNPLADPKRPSIEESRALFRCDQSDFIISKKCVHRPIINCIMYF